MLSISRHIMYLDWEPIMKYLAIIFTLSFVTACASPQYNYRPPSVEISEPPIGAVSIARVGDILVRQGNYIEADAVLVHEAFSVGLLGVYSFSPGYYTKVGEDNNSTFHEPESGPEGGSVKRGALSDPYQSMQVMKGKSKICGISVLAGKACKKNVKFDRVKRPSLTANSFQQALIYSGRVGNKINIGYREFSNSLARPAFNNEVEYDLGASNLIAYKGARLEVLEATNEYIKYRVLSNFNSSPALGKVLKE